MYPKWRNSFTEHPPYPPNQIYGTLYIDGDPAPQGITIQAVLDGFCRGDDITNKQGDFIMFPPEGLDNEEIGTVFDSNRGHVRTCSVKFSRY